MRAPKRKTGIRTDADPKSIKPGLFIGGCPFLGFVGNQITFGGEHLLIWGQNNICFLRSLHVVRESLTYEIIVIVLVCHRNGPILDLNPEFWLPVSDPKMYFIYFHLLTQRVEVHSKEVLGPFFTPQKPSSEDWFL